MVMYFIHVSVLVSKSIMSCSNGMSVSPLNGRSKRTLMLPSRACSNPIPGVKADVPTNPGA